MKPLRWQPDTVATCTLTTGGEYLVVTTSSKWGLSSEPLKPGSRCKIHNGKATKA
jgi:hypothetical protein